jgi:hypothetical protein
MLCITGVRIRRLPLRQKVLTVQVYGRSLVHGGFSRGRDVEKLRKALEKKAGDFQRKKQNAAKVVNRDPEFFVGALKNAVLSSVDRDHWFAVLRRNESAIYGRRETRATPPPGCRVHGRERCMECPTRPVRGFRALFRAGLRREIASNSLPLLRSRPRSWQKPRDCPGLCTQTRRSGSRAPLAAN